MDPGGLGAIIGTGIMAFVFGTMKLYDVYKKRKKQKEFQRAYSKPVLVQKAIPRVLIVKQQWKMKDLNLPKSIKLNNLSIRKF